MKICAKCNREYLDNLNFCSKCGDMLLEKPQEYFCPSCNKSLGETFDKFCPYCGLMFGKIEDTSRDMLSNIVANEYRAHADSSTPNPPEASKIKYLFSFKGRRSRGEAFLAEVVIIFLLLCVACLYAPVHQQVTPLVLVPLVAPLFVAGIANKVRRVHDFNKSGWWLLGYLFISAIIGVVLNSISPVLQDAWSSVAILLLYIPKGTDGPNKYGV